MYDLLLIIISLNLIFYIKEFRLITILSVTYLLQLKFWRLMIITK